MALEGRLSKGVAGERVEALPALEGEDGRGFPLSSRRASHRGERWRAIGRICFDRETRMPPRGLGLLLVGREVAEDAPGSARSDGCAYQTRRFSASRASWWVRA